MLDECVVLLGSTFGERLEPVRVVCHSVLVGPLLHAFCHGVGYRTVEPAAVVDDVDEFLIDIARQVFVHLRTVEHVLSEEL